MYIILQGEIANSSKYIHKSIRFSKIIQIKYSFLYFISKNKKSNLNKKISAKCDQVWIFFIDL